MKAPNLLGSVKPFVSAIAVIVTASFLVFAIYFTMLDLAWITFLAGIVFAGILSMVSRATRAELSAASSGAQKAVAEGRLSEETMKLKKAEAALGHVSSLVQFQDELMPAMVAYIDVEGICRYHNHAFRRMLDLPPQRINGHHLRDVLGRVIFAQTETVMLRALSGETVRYERTQILPNGAALRLNAQFLPVPHEHDPSAGFFMLLTAITEPESAQEPGSAHLSRGKPTAEQAQFDTAVAEHATDKHNARELILAAIERNEFTLLRQRIVPLAGSGGPAHFEILIRLLEEENNMIPPGAFFPLAEEHGLLPYLDRWVTANLMHWVAGRGPQSVGDEHSLYFINVSNATLRDPYFPSYVEQQLHKHELSGANFCFEVAEDDVQSNRGDVEQFAKSVKAAGCKVALSGYGRGRIAVAMLKDLPLDFLKIDGSVIRTVQKDPLSKSKLVAVHKFAKTLGIVTVAEMVESDEITDILRGIGVDYAQGFGIARPEPLA